jgi:SAM-dependent methyltransferase
VKQGTIEEYIEATAEHQPFDAIFAMDVLHHIFVTSKELSQSDKLEPAVALFSSIHKLLAPNGVFLIGEVQRTGLRPAMRRLGLLKGSLNYKNKQNWNQWWYAAKQAGFQLAKKQFYIPYQLRQYRGLLDHPLGHLTVCNRYYLLLSK